MEGLEGDKKTSHKKKHFSKSGMYLVDSNGSRSTCWIDGFLPGKNTADSWGLSTIGSNPFCRIADDCMIEGNFKISFGKASAGISMGSRSGVGKTQHVDAQNH